MKKISVAILDYGVGNHNSVLKCIRKIGYRSKICRDKEELDKSKVIILPGVGAFPTAMQYLYKYDLVSYLQEAHKINKPLIGICLGMQLMAESSQEIKLTSGLGLIPGSVEPISNKKWHIGWNTLETKLEDKVFKTSDGDSMFFNHSYSYQGPKDFILATSRLEKDLPVVAAIRNGKTIGLQFHPEKSQYAGLKLLQKIINELVKN